MILIMDLLQSILRTCDAEQYIENFRNNGIDSFTLKLLVEDDLKTIGVEDKNIRNKILEHTSNLQIPAEKRIETTVDDNYSLLVLSQMSVQLHKHFANLSYALKRKDTDICNVKITPAVECLEDCLQSLDEKLEKFDKIVTYYNKKSKYRRTRNILFPTIVISALVLFMYKKYITY